MSIQICVKSRRPWLKFGRGVSIFAVMLSPAAVAFGQAPPAAPAATSSLTLTDWVVLVVDRNQTQASEASLFKSTLPGFVESRRQSTPSTAVNVPMPIGVIHFDGAPGDGRPKTDVLLEAAGGRFLATWPPARSTVDRELWQNLEFNGDETAAPLLPGEHWLSGLRAADSRWLAAAGRIERFLIYDVQLPYANPLGVSQAKDGSYAAANSGAGPLRDLAVYKPDEEGWRVGEIALLPGSGVVAAPARMNRPAAIPPAPVAADVVLEEAGREIITPTPIPVPSTQPAAERSAPLNFAPKSRNAQAALSPWRERLTSQGLSATDAKLILTILNEYALDKDRLSAVYQLDPAEHEAMLRLEVVPEPRKTNRVALVIVRNIDPGIEQEIDQLIKQMGDDDWSHRQAAHARLTKLGTLARQKIEAAQQSKDPEIAWRAERLLAVLNGPPKSQEQP